MNTPGGSLHHFTAGIRHFLRLSARENHIVRSFRVTTKYFTHPWHHHFTTISCQSYHCSHQPTTDSTVLLLPQLPLPHPPTPQLLSALLPPPPLHHDHYHDDHHHCHNGHHSDTTTTTTTVSAPTTAVNSITFSSLASAVSIAT